VDTRSTKQRATANLPEPRAAKAGKSDTMTAAPALDLADMERRLRDTHAIGVFTKLSLKNQVDDLLGELRLFHQASGKFALAELRQHYDALILKVVTLLQDGDPPLASAISSSREAIWSILADPDKFSKL
jgi:hypothetical protein